MVDSLPTHMEGLNLSVCLSKFGSGTWALDEIVLTHIIYIFRPMTQTSKAVKEITVSNEVIGVQFAYLATKTLIPFKFLKDVANEFFTAVAKDLAGRIICSLE